MKKPLLQRLWTGALSLKGRISEVELPHLVLPLTVEPSKPRLCHDARFLNLWMMDVSFKEDSITNLPRYVAQNTYQTVLDDNYGYLNGQLSVSQRRGIIKLIPKKSEELYYIRNWRPLTLLNCDYKIAAKAIASRLKIYLPKLINNDQTGFIKGRFIGENVRLIDSVINYAASKNLKGLLLFLDFEKAFDTLEWSFIRRSLVSFGFGASIVQWFMTFYCNSESCISNNGWSSNFFTVHRGVRQGCPLSPYLFVLAVEILAKK